MHDVFLEDYILFRMDLGCRLILFRKIHIAADGALQCTIPYRIPSFRIDPKRAQLIPRRVRVAAEGAEVCTINSANDTYRFAWLRGVHN